MIEYLTKEQVVEFLTEQKNKVELKPKRKVYFDTGTTTIFHDGNIIEYYNSNNLCEVYHNGVELKYFDEYGNSKSFSEEKLDEIDFFLEDEDEFKRRLEFSEEIDKLLEI